MRKDPPITVRGALQILGVHDRPWLDRVNRLLGGAVLASGAVPAVAAVWGWVDQKNEAMGLVRGALDAVADRIRGTSGLMRQELVVAAHSTIVLTAYFDALRDRLGEAYDLAKITDAEKRLIAAGGNPHERAVRQLYEAAVPTPSATRGFEENAAQVAAWSAMLTPRLVNLLEGVDPGLKVSEEAERRYRSHFLTVAATVPEFAIWSTMTEHAAISHGLATLTDLLANGPAASLRDHRALLEQVNRAELDLPVMTAVSAPPVFPTVRALFQTPRFRMTEVGPATRIADESWWDELPVHGVLQHTLARHFSSPEATQRPLLLLGHPGAGKSLLMKVLAARLPASDYTVVRVPLRHVDASGSVLAQIDQALHQATHGRVAWTDLDRESVRVVLLDGLDELLQATSHDRSAYLRDVEQFQRTEAVMGQPVAVVVTSRTLVAERVTVPQGTPVVKLEDFDDDQIGRWIDAWNDVNSGAMTVEIARALPELSKQPLLLMMLAVYCADNEVPSLDAGTSLADLYEKLFDRFARREAAKSAPDDLDAAASDHLRRLSIAALGMLNRGAQHISEADLSADLAALGEPTPSGKRVLGEFFFVHTAQATAGSVTRTYEFLHATFGEYLVADRVVEVLRDVAESAYGRRNVHEPDDELLFALLSHQPLAIQPPALAFIRSRIEELDAEERARITRTLNRLRETFRTRRSSGRFDAYRPTPVDHVRQLAAYSANLVLLGQSSHIRRYGSRSESWQSMVHLWRSGLDPQGIRAMLSDLVAAFGQRETEEVLFALLLGDDRLTQRLRIGDAIMYGGRQPLTRPHEWYEITFNALMALVAGHEEFGLHPPPRRTDIHQIERIADLAPRVLVAMRSSWTDDQVRAFTGWMRSLDRERRGGPAVGG